MEQRSSGTPTKTAKGATDQRKSRHSRRTGSPARKASKPKKHREPAGQPAALDASPRTAAQDSPADSRPGPSPKRSDSIGSNSLARMKDLALTGREDQRRPSESSWRRAKVAGLSCARTATPLCVFCVALVGAGLLTALILGSSATRKARQIAFQYKGCTTRGCQEHLERLSNTLNKTVDPCRDPMAYVCDKVRWRSEIVRDALTDTLVHWYELGATFLEKQRRPSPVSALYQGCVSRKGHTYDRLEEVLSFLMDRGLHWPQRVTGVGANKHALNVILDLLINWGVPFWLEISLKQLPGHTRYSLHMAYSMVSVHSAKWLNYTKAYGKRLEYVRSMYRLYGAGDTPLAQLRDLVADEDAWVRAVTDGIASSNRVIMKLRLAHLDQLTPNVSSRRWLDYLNEHLRPHRLSPDDKLLLVDKIVSTVTNNLFERSQPSWHATSIHYDVRKQHRSAAKQFVRIRNAKTSTQRCHEEEERAGRLSSRAKTSGVRRRGGRRRRRTSLAMEQRSSGTPAKTAKGATAQRKSRHSRRTGSPAQKASKPKKHREPAGQPAALDASAPTQLAPAAQDSPADSRPGPSPKRSDSIGSNSLARMKDLALIGREDQRRPSESSRWRAKVAGLSCARTATPLCVFCVALVGSGVLTALILGSSATRKARQMAFQYKGCTTRGCQEHLERLSNTLNKTVDPCRDPMAYVCDKVRWRSEIVTDALTDSLVRWCELGATFLEKQRRPSPVSALYQGCVSRKGHTYERLEEVLSFLRDRGLHWPQRVTGVGATKHALNVILDLLINWGVPFWLEISLKQLPGDTRYSLHMAYSEVSVHRAKWLNYSKAYGKRLEYVRSMYRLYGAGHTPLAQLRDLVADEDAWVRAVTDGIASSNRVIMKLRLAHLDQLTPNVSSHRWLDYLNEHLRPHRLSPDDKLLLVDKIVSTVTNNLFERSQPSWHATSIHYNVRKQRRSAAKQFVRIRNAKTSTQRCHEEEERAGRLSSRAKTSGVRRRGGRRRRRTSLAMEQRSSGTPAKTAKGATAQRKSRHSRRTGSPAQKASKPKKHREPAGQPAALDASAPTQLAPAAQDSPADSRPGPSPKRSDSIGSNSLARMKDLALSGREDQRRPSESSWRRAKVAGMSCARTATPLCVFCVALVGAGVLTALILGSSATRKARQMAFQYKGCTTRGCQEHLEHLSNTLNKTVDPCWDPMAYVCDKVRWRSEIVRDALTDTLVHWYELGATFLEKQRRPSPVSALYQGCVSRKGHTYDRLEEVLSFLMDRGLHWPQRVTGVGANKHALNVILDLLINWGVPFWLEISLKQLPGHTRYSLHMAYSEVSVHRAKWLNYSKAYGKRLEYVRSMYRLYGAGDTPLAQLRDLVADEDAWVRAVTDGIASSNRVIMKLRLAHLDQLTPNVSSRRWLDYLNEHLRPHRLSPDDKLLLVDKIVSTVTNNLFERFSNAAILEQVAWRFIEDYSYANAYAAAVATFGNREAVDRFRPRNCYSFTESRFQKWLFVWRVGEQLQPPFLSTVNAIFEDLRNTTQRLLSDAVPWIDPAARIEAVAILQRLHLEPFWSLFGAEGFNPMLPLSAIHKYLNAFPTQFSSPLKGWMQAADLHRRTFPGWPLNDSLLHRHGEYSFPVEYDYWWNSVYLHLAVAAPPMFYTDAPTSVNYAAFGWAVARQLVRGFDPQKGAFLDSNRTVRSWMSRATREELQKKISCAGGRSSVLMDVAAAQVAYRAFQEHRAAEPRRYAVSKDISLTPDMLFFVTLCRSLCGRCELCPKLAPTVLIVPAFPHCPSVCEGAGGTGPLPVSAVILVSDSFDDGDDDLHAFGA
ncbi:uncharacterized protein [Dermacentor albipictus]|uniref:uncharacterized protein isoform X3 n=1 Tax=Dermacentor albipictus TaxID=60249 RepID=UPI0038FBFB14